VIDALMVVWYGLPETIEHVAPQTPGERGRHRRRGRPVSPPRSARCPTLFCTSDYCEQLPARTHLDHPNYRFNFSQPASDGRDAGPARRSAISTVQGSCLP
jgi:hypothetical protein